MHLCKLEFLSCATHIDLIQHYVYVMSSVSPTSETILIEISDLST